MASVHVMSERTCAYNESRGFGVERSQPSFLPPFKCSKSSSTNCQINWSLLWNMSSFKIVEHTLPGQHIREHPHSLSGRQEGVVQLAIKQYIPLDQPSPVPENAVTIIGLHGNGSPKVSSPPIGSSRLRSWLTRAGIV